jgi:hypothetical protein
MQHTKVRRYSIRVHRDQCNPGYTMAQAEDSAPGRSMPEPEKLKKVFLVREQTHHRLACSDALYRLGDQRRHRQLAYLLAGSRRVVQGDRIGDDDLVQCHALGDPLYGRA